MKSIPVGHHEFMCSLITGVFDCGPPQPKYSCWWNVQCALDFIKRNWAHTNEISDKHLTLKLVALLVLTSASKYPSICRLNVRFMQFSDNKVTFSFYKLHNI